MSTQRITPIHYRRLVKVFELDGFIFKRQKNRRNISRGGAGTCLRLKDRQAQGRRGNIERELVKPGLLCG